MDQTEVSVDELLSGLKRRGLPLPFEIGAFIALEACEQVLDRPVRLDAHDIGIGDIGEVVCAPKKTPVSEESAVRSLMLLLSELLVCSAPGVPSMLLDLVEHGPSSGEWRLDRLRDDLEASLVPLNRGATRRVLSRLAREAKRAGIERASKPSIVPAASEIDAQFDALMSTDKRDREDRAERADKAAKPQPRAAAKPEPRAQPQPEPAPRAASAPILQAQQSISSSISSASATAFAAPRSSSKPPSGSPGATPRGSFTRADDAATLEFELGRAPQSDTQAASLRAMHAAAPGTLPDSQPSAARGAPPRAAAPVSPAHAALEPSPLDDSSLLDALEPSRDPEPERRPRHDSQPDRSSDRGGEDRAARLSADPRAKRETEDRRERVRGTLKRSGRDDDEAAYGESVRAGGQVDDLLADMPERENSRWPAIAGAALVVAAVSLAGVYLALGQAGARRVLGLAPVQEQPLPDPNAATARPARAAGTLVVSSEPGRAQVFLFIGNGPATATDLPIGVAQEFVAMAEGYAPARAIVPADAQWEEASGQAPRYELAMQGGPLGAPERALELGATLLPKDVGSPSGRLGSVRVITTPKGAKVYQLIGFTPDVRVENLPLEEGYEVLVYLPGFGLQTRRVEPADFKQQDGGRVAEIMVPLAAARRK